MTLHDMKPLQTGYIRENNAAGKCRQRLLDLGLVPGTKVRVEQVAPLGDPIGISLRNYQLMLRREQAKSIVVTYEAES